MAVGAVRRNFAPWSEPGAEPLIRFDGVTKRYGAVTAVDALSLSIYEREFFCLLGPSGCGKTTLMRLLAGFETPDEGRVLLAGVDQAAIPPHLRPVNMMFQSYALFPHMSVEGNIAFGLRQEGLPRDEIRARVDDMLRLVQLSGLAKRRPDQLSGGQRQRVALARALAKRPKVLLLDEPLAALDKKLREATQFELMDIQMSLGTTFLVVTHDQEEAMAMADRIAVMGHGRIAQLDPPNVIYEQPASRYVAQFIGDVNLLEGEVTGRDGDLCTVSCPAVGSALLVASTEPSAPGQAVAVAIRPEKMRLGRGLPPPGTANAIVGEVWDIGYLGDWTTYVIRLADGHLLRASQANVARFVEQPLTWEETVHAVFAPDAAVLLSR
ncbi:polyamine-transporting ATPase [Chelatococcus reniformis]|uniref:Spermidine/putrescine import ATP-binding protein PotA n=1 Tax=Chelatococcus reniformis TaxID=1494448 RepID=A0A916XAB5_9HYPH|nr:polyamine-transporting ATPase [Chelatococcus reniformis]